MTGQRPGVYEKKSTSKAIDVEAIFDQSGLVARAAIQEHGKRLDPQLMSGRAFFLASTAIKSLADLVDRANSAEQERTALLDLIAEQDRRIAALEKRA